MAVHVMFLSSCVSSQHLSPLDVVNGSKEVDVVNEDSVVEVSKFDVVEIDDVIVVVVVVVVEVVEVVPM